MCGRNTDSYGICFALCQTADENPTAIFLAPGACDPFSHFVMASWSSLTKFDTLSRLLRRFTFIQWNDPDVSNVHDNNTSTLSTQLGTQFKKALNKFVLQTLHEQSTLKRRKIHHPVTILHIPRQLGCRETCQYLTWLDYRNNDWTKICSQDLKHYFIYYLWHGATYFTLLSAIINRCSRISLRTVITY